MATSYSRLPHCYRREDEEHSTEERRQVMVGISDRQRVLTGTLVERETTIQANGQARVVVTRIITAARATRRERQTYEEE